MNQADFESLKKRYYELKRLVNSDYRGVYNEKSREIFREYYIAREKYIKYTGDINA